VIGPPFSQDGGTLGALGWGARPLAFAPAPRPPAAPCGRGFCGMLAPVRPSLARPWARCALGSGLLRASRPCGPGPWLRSSLGPSLGLPARRSPVARAAIPPGLGALQRAGPCPLRSVALAGPYCWPARGPSSLCGGPLAAVGPALAGVGFGLGAWPRFARRAPGPPLAAACAASGLWPLPSLLPRRGHTAPSGGLFCGPVPPARGAWNGKPLGRNAFLTGVGMTSRKKEVKSDWKSLRS